MKKELFEQQLKAVLASLDELHSQSQLQEATVLFFGKEADKLKEQILANTEPDKEAELEKKNSALRKRMELEIECVQRGIAKRMALEQKLAELKALFEAGKIEEA